MKQRGGKQNIGIKRNDVKNFAGKSFHSHKKPVEGFKKLEQGNPIVKKEIVPIVNKIALKKKHNEKISKGL